MSSCSRAGAMADNILPYDWCACENRYYSVDQVLRRASGYGEQQPGTLLGLNETKTVFLFRVSLQSLDSMKLFSQCTTFVISVAV